ncbi:hypothetical protein GQX73_g3354 [Xylaria multiplex]|uniref:AAA+ ATPase domain-containing protein n=1 Tax=Xylaria multiplex TaxID=323545 RepID=A0A7C8N0L4_9PEZI|nr:hypothetical protein GQX73_g3354 [Xylaria multiplex]
MPLLSSPVVYPTSSSSTAAKRPIPHTDSQPRLRGKPGFLLDDDSDDENTPSEPARKRQMISRPRNTISTSARLSEPPPTPPLLAQLDANNHRSNGDSPFTLNKTSIFDQLATFLPQSTSKITTCSGKTVDIRKRKINNEVSYERIVAARSKTKKGRAERSYYGIDIHELIDSASKQLAQRDEMPTSIPGGPMPSIEEQTTKKSRTLLWTEKYRARNFIDLVGDDLTNRQVLKWLKRWDPIVFPGAPKSRPAIRRPGLKVEVEEEKPHRSILMLTGPPGLGKTTLAHVCARQAGYEVMEINASDDRSRDVVKNRIRTSLGTENVKTVQHSKTQTDKRKVARPVCVVVDEVDGVVTGSGGSGEGGFIKALMDLITIGEKNAAGQESKVQHQGRHKKKRRRFSSNATSHTHL